MNEQLNIVLCEVEKEARLGNVENKLDSLQDLVKGDIEFFDLDDGTTVVCNEEGKVNRMELNRAIRDENNGIIEVIAGDFFIAGSDYETGDIKSLTDEQIEKIMKKYKYPEHIYMINKTIIAEQYIPKNKGICDERIYPRGEAFLQL